MGIEKKMYCEHGFCECPYKTEGDCNLFLPLPGSALCSLSPMVSQDIRNKNKDGCDIAVSLHEGIDE